MGLIERLWWDINIMGAHTVILNVTLMSQNIKPLFYNGLLEKGALYLPKAKCSWTNQIALNNKFTQPISCIYIMSALFINTVYIQSTLAV